MAGPTGGTERRQSGEIRVLHVEDDPDFADLTASFLTRISESFSIRTVTTPSAALDRVREESFDCIVSDYDLPEMTGLDLLEGVREIEPDVPLILFTGKGSEEIASRAISAGVTDYLQKTVGTDQYTVLANRIENAVEQHRSRQALAESQERLSRFIEQSPLGTIEFDESFTIVRVNDAATEILGYEESELVGETWLPFIPADERRHVAEVERELLKNRGGDRSVNDIVTKDGERRQATWYNRVVTDEDGDVISIFSQFEDITEEYEQRQALERSNVLRSRIFEMLPVGILAADPDDRVIRINDRLLELLGLPGPTEVVVGADCDAFVEYIGDRFADPEGFLDRIDHITSARDPVWNDELVLDNGDAVERSYRPIELPEGPGDLWVYYDVTDRRTREHRLEALSETARELMAAETRQEVAEIGVSAAETVLGLDANAIHFFEEGTGLQPVASTDAIWDHIDELPTFTEGDSIAWRAYDRNETISIDDVREDPDHFNPDTAIRSELHLPLDDYGILIAGSPAVGAFDRSDEVLGEILATTLVTALEQVGRTEQLRQREQRLSSQNARLEEFASVVSHDLRNPLNVAEGRLDLAMAECDSDHLEHVSRAHDRMMELIQELLSLAREYDTDIDPVPVDLNSFIESCWCNVDTGNSRIAIRTDQTIRADKPQLKRVIENLLRNAVEHGGEDVTVTVGALADGFYVADDGPGISPEARARVFEYGYSTSADGTGLGLSIVQQCVETHGWEIEVTEGRDGGARFEITGVDVVSEAS